MAKAEILSKIKDAETEAKAGVQRALEGKDQKIADATTEAANIVSNAEVEAQESFDKQFAEAASEVAAEKQAIIDSGMRNVDSMRTSAAGKLDAVGEYLLKEFMGLLHA